MARTTHTTDKPVVLEGYQAIMKPSQYGHSLGTVLSQELIDKLEAEREEQLEWAKSKVKNPKRAVPKPEPWEEVSEGQYKVKFSWTPDKNPVVVVDSEGTPITDENTPLYSGSTVNLAFFQKPYILPDNSYGTSLKLQAVQVISAGSSAGVDVGATSPEEAAALFTKQAGFKVGEPNVIVNEIPESVLPGDDDF